MKNNIIIFGNSLFISTKCEDSNFYVVPNKITSRLNDKFMVDNFSNMNLCVEETINYINEFARIKKYYYCVLNLGEADYNKTDLTEFKNGLLKIIKLLKSYDVLPVMVSLPNKFLKKDGAMNYQEAIDEIAINEKLLYVYSGDLDIDNTIKVKNASQIKRALTDLCI
ncbi:MAG: hypothetical protein E7176_06090 [Erysipelotrichaceae bacterium]|nr:hypothetical protein [Erysipelotrichaceae bacterium]